MGITFTVNEKALLPSSNIFGERNENNDVPQYTEYSITGTNTIFFNSRKQNRDTSFGELGNVVDSPNCIHSNMMKWNHGASKISMKALPIFSLNVIARGLSIADIFAIGNMSSVAQFTQQFPVRPRSECSVTNPKTPFLSQ